MLNKIIVKKEFLANKKHLKKMVKNKLIIKELIFKITKGKTGIMKCGHRKRNHLEK